MPKVFPVPVSRWLLLTALGSAPVLFLLATDILTTHGVLMDSGYVWGRDFVNLWTGGRLVAEAKLGTLYDPDAYFAYLRTSWGVIEPHFYSYPPTSLFIGAVFGQLAYPVALAAWIAGTLALFLWAAKPYVRAVSGFPLWMAAITPAGVVNLWAGHYGFLIGALWLACFARVDRKPRGAGLFAALLTIKPHLGLLIPPILLARRSWRAILVAIVASAVFALLSIHLFGFALWVEYLTKVSRFQASLLDNDGAFFLTMMPGTLTALRVAGMSGAAAWIAHLGVAAVAFFLVWQAVRREAATMDLAFIAATATFLILPYAFNYDMTVVCLGFALMLFRHGESLSRPAQLILLAGFLSPQSTFVGATLGLPLTPVILLAGLFVQVRIARAQGGDLKPYKPAPALPGFGRRREA